MTFALVFVWAFVGIDVRHGSEVIIITVIAWFGAASIIYMLAKTNSTLLYNCPKRFV